jgi:hypothetical protein
MRGKTNSKVAEIRKPLLDVDDTTQVGNRGQDKLSISVDDINGIIK